MQDAIDELRRYVTGWLKYFGVSHTYTELLALDEWVRHGSLFTAGQRPASDWNRAVRTRMPDGAGAGADLPGHSPRRPNWRSDVLVATGADFSVA